MSLFRRTSTHYVDDDGKRVAKDTPGAQPVTTTSDTWSARYMDATGKKRVVALSKNKQAAKAKLGEILQAVEREKITGISEREQTEIKKPLTDHLREFVKSLRDRGRSEPHVKLIESRTRRIITGCRFTKASDIDQTKVERLLGTLRDEGISQQTINHYVRAVKQFATWLRSAGRLRGNPLGFLKCESVAHDRRIERREMTSAEIAELLAATKAGPDRRKLSGDQRHALYVVALSTGLRASELASLTPRSFDLAGDVPTVTIRAENEKAKRGAVLPLPADAAEVVRELILSTDLDAKLWPGKWADQNDAGRILKKDLAAAREGWLSDAGSDQERSDREADDFLMPTDAEGRKLDFHALRHTYLSRLARSGAPAKVMQLLARHSTVELTIGRYTHAGLLDLAGAVENLPELEGESDAERLRIA